MTKKVLKFAVIIISIIIFSILFYYGKIYRTNFSEFTNVNINDINKLEIHILYYDKPSEEFNIDNKEKINQIINVLNDYKLCRNIVKEKLRVIGINKSYVYTRNNVKEPNRSTNISIYMDNSIISLRLFLNKYMFIMSDRPNSYEFEIIDKEYDINNIRDICIDEN